MLSMSPQSFSPEPMQTRTRGGPSAQLYILATTNGRLEFVHASARADKIYPATVAVSAGHFCRLDLSPATGADRVSEERGCGAERAPR